MPSECDVDLKLCVPSALDFGDETDSFTVEQTDPTNLAADKEQKDNPLMLLSLRKVFPDMVRRFAMRGSASTGAHSVPDQL